MPWTLAKGHKGPVKGLRASGPQGPDPLFTHYSLFLYSRVHQTSCSVGTTRFFSGIKWPEPKAVHLYPAGVEFEMYRPKPLITLCLQDMQ
jgi:hypothetical protein